MDKVRVLSLMGILDLRVFSIAVEQSLAHQLVELRIETLRLCDYFYLERILKGCPKLEALRVEPQSDKIYRQDILESYPEEPGSMRDIVRETMSEFIKLQEVEPLDWSENLKLKTLVLAFPAISQRVIQAILARCPDMKVLKLISLIERAPNPDTITLESSSTSTFQHNISSYFELAYTFRTPPPSTSPYNLIELVSHVAKSCKTLHTFHLSLQSRKLDPEIINNAFEQLSTVRYWDFAACDIISAGVLPALQVKTMPSTQLTFLELRCLGSRDPSRSTEPLTKALHDFLCTTPTLLHLIAPLVAYYIEYLDVNKTMLVLDGGTTTPLTTDGKFWVCRNLKTLHLDIRGQHDSQHKLQHDRMIFGYLSKVTPRLEDLKLNVDHISFDFYGGLCLLTRLHNLERVNLHCQSYSEYKTTDVLEWINRVGNPWDFVSSDRVIINSKFSPVEDARLSCGLDMIRSGQLVPSTNYHTAWCNARYLTTLSMGNSITMSSFEYPELTLSDFDNLGDMKDIEDLRIEWMMLHQFQQPCWLRLESFTISFLTIYRPSTMKNDYKLISDPRQPCKVILDGGFK
ncbi:hypothetical protein BGZ76_002681 [Entomortierella beljakovae]|nr:hypothetical protein BGZ76_002681 [Entomortierella beljakovae]